MSETKSRGASYRQRVLARSATEKHYEEVLPSGETFTLRKPDLEAFLRSGALPLALVEKMEKARLSGADEAETFQTLNVKEQIKAIEFSAKLVRYCCVNPRIVDEPQSDDEIAPDELLRIDYDYILEWAKDGAEFNAGGEQADGLDDFRGKRSKPFMGSVNGKKLRAAPK